MEKIDIKIDKELDVLTAYINEADNDKSNLEVIEVDLNILFHVNAKTKELVFIQIYDYFVVKRLLIRKMFFLTTKGALKTWLNTIIESYRANNKLKEKFA